MKLFTTMYDKTVEWAEHKRATWLLGGLSFAESSFFPIPVEAMLAPMSLAKPKRWWWFALVATLASVLGGVFGYLIGALLDNQVQTLIQYFDWEAGFENARERIDKEGAWVLFLASFTPIPYKLATISAGTLGMNVILFMVVSFIGRGLRFALVAGIVALFGPVFAKKFRDYFEWMGWGCTALFCAWMGWHFFGGSIRGVFS